MNEPLLDYKFKALSDKTRREILCFLKNGKKCAGDIVNEFSITAPSISYHLNILTKSKLISAHRNRGFIIYELNIAELNEVMVWLENIMFM